MKRSKGALVVLIIGLVILVLSPIWKWGIGPMLIKVPDTIDTTSVYDGTLTLYVDPTSLALLPPEMAVVIPLSIARRDLSQPAKSTGSVAVIKETTNAKGPAGKEFINTTHYFAIDRKTSENVPGNGSDTNRKGFYPILPIGAKKITYQLWDQDTGKTGPANFTKTVTREGFKFKNVQCYEYKATGKPDPTVEPPLGLPKTISGAQIKSLASGIPGLSPTLLAGLVDTQKYPITYQKQTTATIVAEPRTGSIVQVPLNTEAYFVDASAMGLPSIKLAQVQYRQTPEKVAEVIDESAANWGLLDMVGLWIPLILLIVGVIVAAIGGIWFARKKPGVA
ncbi:MAG: porin PorA family protein [Candidatus Geothermincolia bacterium]